MNGCPIVQIPKSAIHVFVFCFLFFQIWTEMLRLWHIICPVCVRPCLVGSNGVITILLRAISSSKSCCFAASPWKVVFFTLDWFLFGLFVCRQDYATSCEWISKKPGTTQHQRKKNPLQFSLKPPTAVAFFWLVFFFWFRLTMMFLYSTVRCFCFFSEILSNWTKKVTSEWLEITV